MRIIGFDADSENVGVCILDNSACQAGTAVTEFMTLSLPGDTYEARAMRFWQLMDDLRECYWHEGDMLAVEQINVPRNLDTVRKLAYLVGLLAAAFGRWPILVNTAAAYSVVGLSTRMGRTALKRWVSNHVTAICREHGWSLPVDEHQANAYCVAEWARIHIR